MEVTTSGTYVPGAGLAAGSLMLKWNLIDNLLGYSTLKLQPGDHVNVFINLESVLKNLSIGKGHVTAVNFHKQKFVLEMESSILNLMANYRMYFKKERCDPHMYFYYTDLAFADQQMSIYNKYYRTYYQNQYMQNPKFKIVGELMNNTILPETSLILQYIPGCYMIKSNNFDSSIIPLIISEFSPAKNVIVSGDVFDTLYMFNPNFIDIYIKRRFGNLSMASTIGDTVKSIVKNASDVDLSIFKSEMYYRLLLSIKGSKIRNIRSAKGFGYIKFMNIMQQGIKDGIVLRDFSSIDSIIQLFPEQYREDIRNAFQCTSLETQYDLLSSSDIINIKSQLVDKVDMKSIEALNNKRFLEFPINLQGLLN